MWSFDNDTHVRLYKIRTIIVCEIVFLTNDRSSKIDAVTHTHAIKRWKCKMAMYFVYEWLKQEVCALFQAILVAKFNSFDRYTNQKRRRRRFFSQQKKKKKTYKRKRRQSQRLLWEKFKCPDSPRIKQWLVVNIITVILSFRFTFFKTSLFITFETEFFQRWCLLSLSLSETNRMQADSGS